MSHYFIWTIGCQMNKAESQQVAGYLDAAGYRPASSLSRADLVVLNTCVVRQSAEDKVLGTLGLLKGLKEQHPSMQILVTGCFVDSDVGSLQRQFPHVDLWFKPGDYGELIAWITKRGLSVQQASLPRTSSPCALVPIIQGCDNFCSYCIVPYRRGREISRPLEEIVCEVRTLTKQGVREVVLLGQNVDSYGHDLPGHPDLADLLSELNDVDGLWRIRFLTNHPKDVSQKLIDAIASLEKVCEHLELPVQSGDDDILKAMRRGYTVEQYRKLVDTIRNRIPEVALSTDMIVGFPGETEEQFQHSLSLLKELRFDVVHVAAYSPRPGTIASIQYKDDVSPKIKKERRDTIEALQEEIAYEINSKLQGKEVEVLVEGKKKGKWFGRTRTNKLVFFEDRANWLGRLVLIKVNQVSPWALQGEVLDSVKLENEAK